MGTPRELKQYGETAVIATLLDATAKTDGVPTCFVIGESGVRKFIVSTKVETGATAPGTSKTVTVNLYWANEYVPEANAAAQLVKRKTALTPIALPNSANTIQHDKISGDTPVTVEARFLYLTVDQTVLATGATVGLTVWIAAAD